MASEIIDQVPNLAISSQFTMADGYPMSHRNGIALYPAIAIPVETKQQYECPEEHLAVLRQFIPKTTKLLMIGWRATENHFLNLLQESIHHQLRVMTVSGSVDGAKESVENLKKARLYIDVPIESSNGFTAFIVNREGDGFLSS